MSVNSWDGTVSARAVNADTICGQSTLSPIDIARPPFQTQFLEALHECFHEIAGHAPETSVIIDEQLNGLT